FPWCTYEPHIARVAVTHEWRSAVIGPHRSAATRTTTVGGPRATAWCDRDFGGECGGGTRHRSETRRASGCRGSARPGRGRVGRGGPRSRGGRRKSPDGAGGCHRRQGRGPRGRTRRNGTRPGEGMGERGL